MFEGRASSFQLQTSELVFYSQFSDAPQTTESRPEGVGTCLKRIHVWTGGGGGESVHVPVLFLWTNVSRIYLQFKIQYFMLLDSFLRPRFSVWATNITNICIIVPTCYRSFTVALDCLVHLFTQQQYNPVFLVSRTNFEVGGGCRGGENPITVARHCDDAFLLFFRILKINM